MFVKNLYLVLLNILYYVNFILLVYSIIIIVIIIINILFYYYILLTKQNVNLNDLPKSSSTIYYNKTHIQFTFSSQTISKMIQKPAWIKNFWNPKNKLLP